MSTLSEEATVSVLDRSVGTFSIPKMKYVHELQCTKIQKGHFLAFIPSVVSIANSCFLLHPLQGLATFSLGSDVSSPVADYSVDKGLIDALTAYVGDLRWDANDKKMFFRINLLRLDKNLYFTIHEVSLYNRFQILRYNKGKGVSCALPN